LANAEAVKIEPIKEKTIAVAVILRDIHPPHTKKNKAGTLKPISSTCHE
jgi:hypothetical protein